MLRLFAPSFVLSMVVFLSPQAQAKQAWENCLDNGDFEYTLNTFSEGTFTARKSGCVIHLAQSFGQGEKFDVDLCDPLIHIGYFSQMDSLSPERVIAPAGACSSAIFGADYEENAKDIAIYAKHRKRVLDLFAKIKSVYGTNADHLNIEDPKILAHESSDGKIACGQFLLRSYLIKCDAFEQKKGGSSSGAEKNTSFNPSLPPPPGVHPQTILPKNPSPSP
jgi:hypothetical protein